MKNLLKLTLILLIFTIVSLIPSILGEEVVYIKKPDTFSYYQ